MTRPPGMLRLSQNPDVLMMICTAGHVDHGKTSLVKMLTGCSTDRLKVEQERGLTIELGFAPCVLGGELCVGIVDVPGHERFIKNMVAGVSGISLAVLVIAADDGVMPQTIEHLQIMQLMGVRHGIVALTKIDLVTPDRVEEVSEEVRQFLTGSFMDGATICPLSSETGEGVFAFYDILVATIKSLTEKRRGGVFRMPIERTFAQKGFGTVLTGIPVSGEIRVGDHVELLPGHRTGRVRGIQRFTRDATEAHEGQCLALNISEFGKPQPERGQVLCVPGYLRASQCFHVRLRTVPGIDPPLRNAESIKFHTGTSETHGKVFLLEEKALAPNLEAWATVVTAEAVPVGVGDRFILRRPSPAATVAGGTVELIERDAQRPRKKDLLAKLALHETLIGNASLDTDEILARRVALYLRTEAPTGAMPASISRGLLLTPDEAEVCLDRLKAGGEVTALSDGSIIHRDDYAESLALAVRRIQQARANPSALSITLPDLQKGLKWPAALWESVLAEAVKSSGLGIRGNKLMLKNAADELGEADRALRERILQVYVETGFESPRPEDLPDLLRTNPERTGRLFDHLCDEGLLVRLTKNVVICFDRFRQAQDIVIEIIKTQGALDSAEFKGHINSSRKYALAILDYLDGRKITVRAENIRRLAPNYEDRLL